MCNLPGSSVHGILQARKLGWAAISFSKSCGRQTFSVKVLCMLKGKVKIQCISVCNDKCTHTSCYHALLHFYKLKVSGNPALSKSMRTTFPRAFTPCLWHSLAFQTFSLLSDVLWWPAISDLWCYYHNCFGIFDFFLFFIFLVWWCQAARGTVVPNQRSILHPLW